MKTVVLNDEAVDALVNIAENLLDDPGSFLGGSFATELNDIYEQLTGSKFNDATSQPINVDDVFYGDTSEETSENEEH